MTHVIRKMTHNDLERVKEIEDAAHVSPWSLGIFRDCISVGYLCFVIEKRKRVLGFMIASVQVSECHLLNIAVSPRAQGQGLGRVLLNFLIELVTAHAESIFLEVRPSNTIAINFYRSLGFIKVGTRKNYYQNPDGSHEDAEILFLAL